MRILREIRAVLDNYQVKSGIYHFYRGEYKQAIQFLSRALGGGERLPDWDAGIARDFLTHAHLAAAEEAEAEGDLARSASQIEAAVVLNPRFPDIRFRLARALERGGRLSEAVENYRQACALNPRYLD